jgi:hypothetical protein
MTDKGYFEEKPHFPAQMLLTTAQELRAFANRRPC